MQNNFVINTKDSSIEVGTDKVSYDSENKQRFQGQQCHDKARLDQNYIRDLKAHHFDVGYDPDHFNTSYNDALPEHPIQHKEPFLNQNLHKKNFYLGDQDQNQYQTSYKEQHGKFGIKGEKAKLNLRTKGETDIVLGSDKVDDRFKSEAVQK